MKTGYLIMILAIAAIITMPALPCRAADSNEGKSWLGDEPNWTSRPEIPEKRIERMMELLALTNPEKANELTQLREKDPEKFRAELRKIMREQFSKRFEEHAKQRDGQVSGRLAPPANMPFMGGGEGFGGHPERRMVRERMREEPTELIEWLEKNYPQEAEKLAELEKENPELYPRRLGIFMRQYGPIARASKDNPELAKVLKEDLELRNKQKELLGKISTAANEDEKKELTGKLKDTVSNRFDLIVKRKQMEYERLLKRLEEMKKEVKESEARVEKWKDAKFKEENVNARVEDMIKGAEKFEWD